MTPDEARRFLSEVAFVAFPSVREWLRSTEHPEETFTLWTKAMASVSWTEGQTVIDRWLSGQITPPRFLRDSFVADLRACVPAVRKPQQPQQVESVPEGERYRPTEDPLYLKYWVPLRAAVATGEITEESALAQWKAILDEQFSKAGGTTWIG
ncbi:MAG: hypothetical protein EB060_10425 [Proteobacteria bacterium]|nr:hypothetical protein [Pseudomonadota bacterium]